MLLSINFFPHSDDGDDLLDMNATAHYWQANDTIYHSIRCFCCYSIFLMIYIYLNNITHRYYNLFAAARPRSQNQIVLLQYTCKLI